MKPVKFIALSSRGENKPVTRRQNLYGYQLDPASFDILLNASSPIAIKGYNSAEKYMKVIFWLVPTVELINCLPDSIAVPMRKEFNRNIKPILAGLTEKNGKPVKIDTPQNVFSAEELANPVPCQYFPSFCEGLPGLDNLRVYPIPTSDFLNIEILLLQSKKINPKGGGGGGANRPRNAGWSASGFHSGEPSKRAWLWPWTRCSATPPPSGP